MEGTTHLVLKIFLMEQNKFSKYFSILICLFLISACQLGWIEEQNAYLKNIEFGLNIPDSFKQRSTSYFIEDSSKNNISLKILKLRFKKKNFYGGSAARPKQIEVIGELEYSFQDMISSKNGTLLISGWIPVNENNPQAEIMAQKQLVIELELLLLEDLIQEYWLIES